MAHNPLSHPQAAPPSPLRRKAICSTLSSRIGWAVPAQHLANREMDWPTRPALPSPGRRPGLAAQPRSARGRSRSRCAGGIVGPVGGAAARGTLCRGFDSCRERIRAATLGPRPETGWLMNPPSDPPHTHFIASSQRRLLPSSRSAARRLGLMRGGRQVRCTRRGRRSGGSALVQQRLLAGCTLGLP